MKYTNWGKRIESPLVSKLGFGTTRFNPSDLKDKKGLSKCVELVEYAIEKGINYFDVAPTYSYGQAEKILGLAFKNSLKPTFVAAKTGLAIDKTSDDLLKRIESSLKILNKNIIDFYHIWSVINLKQYDEIKSPKGLLKGAQIAKERGLLKYLCISLHCDADTALKIIDDNYFDGITISMNALNYKNWLSVIKRAKERKMGVATMNSLGGGTIPMYGSIFSDLDNSTDSIPIKALRFLNSFQEIDILLSGMPSKEQIDENCRAFEESESIINKKFELKTDQSLCSGCNYCAPCSVGIPISACMQAYNHKIMMESSDKELDDKLLTNDIFVRIRANGIVFHDLPRCVSCHVCESRCTQKIDISNRLKYLEEKALCYGYTRKAMLHRLREIEKECEKSKHIGIWPSCDYATRLFDFWQNSDFENKCEYFNSSDSLVGTKFRNKTVHGIDELEKLSIDTILIVHYTLRNNIYDSLKTKISPKIKLIKLHDDNSIDWFNQAIGK